MPNKINARYIEGLPVLGFGQTWVNVTASRTKGVQYTNDTGRPIFVAVSRQIGANTMSAAVNGMTIMACQGYGLSDQDVLSFIVPPGATYSITASAASVALWAELR